MAKFVCKVCGYVYEGDAAPAECPVCHVGADMFEEVKGEMKLAAEHAAKFAEMLGEDLEPNMKATTKDNLAWRVDCEFGATAGKVELATCAKKNNLDAIHDTVHEMARDEARHGKALKGLLDRYFGK